MLDKLAKLGRIERPSCAPIVLRGVREPRTPFGTAPAVARIAAELERGEPFRLYHPDSFVLVRGAIEALDEAARTAREVELGALDPALGACLIELGALDAARSVAAGTGDRLRRAEHMKTWFDGLKTLRLVHLLRDRMLGTEPWRRALAQAPFGPATELLDGGLEPLRRALAAAEARI